MSTEPSSNYTGLRTIVKKSARNWEDAAQGQGRPRKKKKKVVEPRNVPTEKKTTKPANDGKTAGTEGKTKKIRRRQHALKMVPAKKKKTQKKKGRARSA